MPNSMRNHRNTLIRIASDLWDEETNPEYTRGMAELIALSTVDTDTEDTDTLIGEITNRITSRIEVLKDEFIQGLLNLKFDPDMGISFGRAGCAFFTEERYIVFFDYLSKSYKLTMDDDEALNRFWDTMFRRNEETWELSFFVGDAPVNSYSEFDRLSKVFTDIFTEHSKLQAEAEPAF